MSLSKVNFAGRSLEVFTVVDKKGEKWHQANPFAEALGYSNANKAIWNHVSKENHREYEPLRSGGIDDSSPALHPRTKFINTAGMFELINASEMPAAKKFRSWENNDLLPTLCHEGEYNMAKDAPVEIAVGMNAVHAATNEGVEAPWMKEIEKRDVENKNLVVALNEQLTLANKKLIEANEALVILSQNMSKALVMINDARKDSELARKETAELANRMADIAQDVITKPSDPQLLHSLAVCAMGGDQYAFLRPQKRSLKRSLDRLSVDERDIVYRSDYVPNAMNVLNKVKEALPKDKYTARHNRITLREDLTKEQLVEVIESTLTPRQIAVARNKIVRK